MQRVNSTKRKSEDVLSKFERAQKLFQDIESILDQEIASTPLMAANYETNIARIKKSKRKRPGLIRNTNTRKNRQVVNNMEYDPETNTWLGNEEALSIFSPMQKAIIMSRGRGDKEKVVNGMVWDPVERVWKGNQSDALKFPTPRKPGEIRFLGSSHLQKEVQGMVFDRINMRWVGNDSDADIFSEVGELHGGGFAVGDEFHLPVALAKSFVDCANRHKSSLSGWFADGAIDRRAHLYAIRNMSIMRIVRDVTQRPTYVDLYDESGEDANVPERDTSSPSPSFSRSGNGGNSEDGNENYDDLPFTNSARLKLPQVRAGGSEGKGVEEEEDWGDDFAMDADEVPTSQNRLNNVQQVPSKINNINNISSSNNSNNNNNKKGDDEDWGDDFAESDVDAFKSKLKVHTLAKKPFQLDPSNKRASVIDLVHRRPSSAEPPVKGESGRGEVKSLGTTAKRVVEEEGDDGFDLPPGPVRLVPKLAWTNSNNDVEPDLDEVGDLDTSEIKHGNGEYEAEEDLEEEEEGEEGEEDWTDVDVPATFPAAPIKRAHNEREEWGEDNDLEIPDPTVFQKRPKLRENEGEGEGESEQKPPHGETEDEGWDGIEFTDNFADKLRR